MHFFGRLVFFYDDGGDVIQSSARQHDWRKLKANWNCSFVCTMPNRHVRRKRTIDVKSRGSTTSAPELEHARSAMSMATKTPVRPMPALQCTMMLTGDGCASAEDARELVAAEVEATEAEATAEGGGEEGTGFS